MRFSPPGFPRQEGSMTGRLLFLLTIVAMAWGLPKFM